MFLELRACVCELIFFAAHARCVRTGAGSRKDLEEVVEEMMKEEENLIGRPTEMALAVVVVADSRRKNSPKDQSHLPIRMHHVRKERMKLKTMPWKMVSVSALRLISAKLFKNR